MATSVGDGGRTEPPRGAVSNNWSIRFDAHCRWWPLARVALREESRGALPGFFRRDCETIVALGHSTENFF